MRNQVVNILLSIGMPASVKGFTYICDAMEIFDQDPYYADGKISVLYREIAKKRGATPYSVERAIRHAFETAIMRGDRTKLEQYLDLVNPQNSNLLRTLYLRMKQNEVTETKHEMICNAETCAVKGEIYREVIAWFSQELERILEKTPGTEL